MNIFGVFVVVCGVAVSSAQTDVCKTKYLFLSFIYIICDKSFNLMVDSRNG